MISKIVCQIIGFLWLVNLTVSLQAQNIRKIQIAQDASYTDHVSLKKDSKDMDLMVKFVFDEPNNVLTVSLVSYRNLFVFQNDVRYKQVVKHKKLRPDRFPYVVEADAEAKYKLTKELRKQIVGSKKKHVFKRWIEYDGLQPQPIDYKMVNDYIEQKFDILDKDTLVTIALRDLLGMEASATKKKQYDFLYFTDLDRKYQIRILRNPCLGKDDEIEAARGLVESVRTNYETLQQQYVSMGTSNQETLLLLQEMRGILLAHFPYKNETSACPTVRQYWDSYNCYIDSISQLEEYHLNFEKQRAKLAIGAEQILGVARIVDNNVASWLISKDVVEKVDLVNRCRLLLDEINQHLVEDVVMDEEQASAVSVFRKAEDYFKKTCLQPKKKK